MDPSFRQNLSSEAFVVFLGNASTAMANLLVGMILVRHFTDKSVFATYSQVMFLATTLVAFVPLGLHRAIIYFFPRVESQRAFAIQTTLFISIIMLVCGMAMVSMRHAVASWMNNPAIATAMPMIFGIMWMQNFSSVLHQVLLATQRSRQLGLFVLLYNGFYLAAILVATSLNVSLSRLLVLIVVLSGLQAAYTLYLIARLPGNTRKIFDFSITKDQFRYSLPLALASFTGIIGKTIDRFIVMYLFAPVIFAVYDRGAIELPFLYQMPYSANSVVQPNLTVLYRDGKLNEFLELWHKVVRKLALMMVPIMFFSWIAARYLIVIVNTDSYVDSVVYFRIYLFLIPFQITIYPSILMATGHTMKIFWVTTLTLAANIAINVILVKGLNLGPTGPAISTVVVEGLKSIIFLWMIGKTLQVGFRNIYPWKELGGIAAVSFAAAATCYPLTLLGVQPLPGILLCFIMFSTVYLLFCLSCRIIGWDELMDIKQMIRMTAK